MSTFIDKINPITEPRKLKFFENNDIINNIGMIQTNGINL